MFVYVGFFFFLMKTKTKRKLTSAAKVLFFCLFVWNIKYKFSFNFDKEDVIRFFLKTLVLKTEIIY